MIIAENLGKKYVSHTGKQNWVLEDVNFTIPRNRNVGILGRNGAGKSTLLRLIGGSDAPTKGTLIRKGRVSWPVGFGGGMQGSLTGRQNAMFVIRVHDRLNDADEIIRRIKEFAEIGDAFDEPVSTYSSGMRARVKFAMSLAFDFDVYISDEVTAVGDASFKAKAREHFRDLVGKAGLIMVSHSEKQLTNFCESGILLHDRKAYWHEDIGDAIDAYNETIRK